MPIKFYLGKLSPVKTVLAFTICFLACSGASVLASPDYSTVQDPNVVVTGIRSDSPDQGTDSVVITALYNLPSGTTAPAIYHGSLAGATAPGAVWTQFTPTISNVTNASFYGPNTAVFSPSLGAGNIIAVGSYQISGTNTTHGLMYQGTVTGTGTWTTIDATPLATGTNTLANTIAHSTMGGLVVGNFDTQTAVGQAFIYNTGSDTWTNLNANGDRSVTAYGIWQNGSSTSTSFTIAGGFSDSNDQGLDQGYIVDYDSSTGLLTNYKTYNFNDSSSDSVTSHFDGITRTDTGFNLTGFYSTVDNLSEGGFMASITVDPDTGAFSNATWTDVSLGLVTTGNTIIGDYVLGIYDDGVSSHSYVATVPEPATWGLLSLGAALLLQRKRSRRKA
ncbi:hypothetical protein BH09VER1_BH09VER1_09130 [soil metagenome]